MKKVSALLLHLTCFISVVSASPVKDSIPVNTKDVGSVDAIMASLYIVISGPAGEKRNWDRM